MLNIKLLDEVLAKIDESPSNWDQEDWASAGPGSFTDRKIAGEPDKLELTESCGTAFCVAGWVAVLNKQEIDWKPRYDWDPATNEEKIIGYRGFYLKDGTSIESYAKKMLGLDHDQANNLFDGGNTRTRLTNLRNALVVAAKNQLSEEKNKATFELLEATKRVGELRLQEEYLNTL